MDDRNQNVFPRAPSVFSALAEILLLLIVPLPGRTAVKNLFNQVTLSFVSIFSYCKRGCLIGYRKGNLEMKTRIHLPAVIILGLIVAFDISRSFAQTNPVFLQLGQAKGALYKPDSGAAPHVGIIVMHREANYMNNIACTEFSKRGFMVLCMNSRFENNESVVNWELIPLDVAQGVNYLRNTQHLSRIILYGNSGRGSTLAKSRGDVAGRTSLGKQTKTI
jgi:hypothetical protein